MPKYGRWIEVTEHFYHEVDADNIEEAERKFDRNESTCTDSQETVNTSDIEIIRL
jgi:hypothetical protein